ncbi:hypothetical protein BDF14DRAFT_392406 [Spinellus fusiger]|nr:hypothetical protein BDF14DRAFT_392406 [Spinellus fusiger]
MIFQPCSFSLYFSLLQIKVTIELHFGRPETSLMNMVAMYEPTAIVLGTRNKARQKHLFSGAGVFKYSLEHTSLPVIVVCDSAPCDDTKEKNKAKLSTQALGQQCDSLKSGRFSPMKVVNQWKQHFYTLLGGS